MSGLDWDKLPEVLAGHTADWCSWGEGPSGPEDSDYYTCICRGPRWHVNTSADYYQAHATHLAAVIRAWVEGQMTEEWGVHTSLYSPYWRSQSRERAEEVARLNPQLGPTIHRRLVTPWAPVEGDQP